MTALRPLWLAWAAVAACSRPQAVEPVSADPSTKPMPVPSAPPPQPLPAPSVTSAPSPIAKKAPEIGQRTCEPIVRCGVWSGCVWLERVDAVRYRAVGGAEKGGLFVRRHECWPAGAGTNHCAVYCTSADGGAPCLDGLHPEDEVCTGAAVPTPNSAVCLIGAGICGSLM